jgi:hypothetical protein
MWDKMGLDFLIKTPNFFAEVFFQLIDFCPNLISHSLFKHPLPPSSTSTLAVDSKGLQESKELSFSHVYQEIIIKNFKCHRRRD